MSLLLVTFVCCHTTVISYLLLPLLGLDSTTAKVVITILRDLAHNHNTTVMFSDPIKLSSLCVYVCESEQRAELNWLLMFACIGDMHNPSAFL